MKIFNATSRYVLFFGLFVMISLIFQCIVPFFAKYVELTGYTGWITIFLNQNFQLPMDIISDFWAAISAAYIGVDRGMYMIDGFKNGEESQAFSEDQLKHLTQVLIESFIVYSLAVSLNLFFDSNLALSPLAVSFGSSCLLYIVGNKAVRGSQTLSSSSDVDGDGIDDNEQDQKEVLDRYKKMLKTREDMLAKFDVMTNTGVSSKAILEKYKDFCRKKGIDESQLLDLDENGIEDSKENASEVLERLKLLIAQGKAIGIRTEINL
jgi:hypothetical protein